MTEDRKREGATPAQAEMSEKVISLWENDVSNLMGNETFRRKVKLGLFGYLQRQGLSPERAYPNLAFSIEREEYRRWLEQRDSSQSGNETQ